MYTDKLDNIVNKYNNTYHITIKMKPVDVKPITYPDSSEEINYQDPKFKIGDLKSEVIVGTFYKKRIVQNK